MSSKRPPRAQCKPGAALQRLQQAVSAMQMRRPEIAEGLALGVLDGEPDNLVASQILGEALLLQNRASEAVRVLQASARLSKDPGTETVLAMALTADGRSEEALDQLRSAITHPPPFPLAFIELGARLGDRGAYEEAVAVFERGLSLMPEVDALRLPLGLLHLRYNERSRARALFGDVLARTPDAPGALAAMARAMALDGENASAIAHYRRALALRPDDGVACVGLAKCLMEMGAREDAEAVLRRVARGDPTLAGAALTALAATPHGRLFMRVTDAKRFIAGESI